MWKIFGKRLSLIMDEAHVSAPQLAEVLNCSVPAVASWRGGKQIPQFETVYKIAELFAVPLDYLYGRCTLEEAERIEENYGEHFRMLRTEAYAKYLKFGSKRERFGNNAVSVWPYNFLESVFPDKRWDTQITEDQMAALESILGAMKERQRAFLLMYYRDEKTLAEIGREYNVTREDVRRTIKRIVEKVRHPSVANCILAGERLTEPIPALTAAASTA